MRSVRFVSLFVILGSILLAAQSNTAAPINQPVTSNVSSGLSKADPKAQGKLLESYGKLPLSFEANQGQTDSQVKFVSRGSGYTLFLTGDEAVFSLRRGKGTVGALPASRELQPTAVPAANTVLRMELVKANPVARVIGTDELPGKSNYFIGSDPKKWRSNVPTYAKVKYENIYPGIDLVYYGNQRQLEYDFVVAPGADPHHIQFDFRGAKSISRDKDGDLLLQMSEGEIRWRKPTVYQERDGTRQEIVAHYVINHKSRVRFEVADYDLHSPLFIDPLIYSTYLGGSGEDVGNGITVDASGNAYLTGQTLSTNFPTTPGALQTTCGGTKCYDAFVTKLNPTGSAFVYSSYLGGSNGDYGLGIIVDSSGNAYVTGDTQSTDFPTTPGAFRTICNGGSNCTQFGDGFVTELNPTGSALVYSTYLGGSNTDQGQGISVDSMGDAYITGLTASADFPTTTGVFQKTFAGGSYDAFVSELNPTGTALVYSTYLGGSSSDYANGVGVDSSGNTYVTGTTCSTDFPITPGAFQTSYGGGNCTIGDAFVTKLNPNGSALAYSTYLGGSSYEIGFSIAVDTSGNAYVTGDTCSTDFPTTPGAFQTRYGGDGGGCTFGDAFVTKLNPTGSALVYSTYLGGNSYDTGFAIAMDSSGNAYVTGFTDSTNFPTMNPLQGSNAGLGDAFVTKLNPTGSALVYSTYLGGSDGDSGQGIAVDNSEDAYVTGSTASINFPTMNPLQAVYGGGGDAFVAEINTKPSSFVTLAPSNLDFGNQTVGITSAPQKSTLTNTGELTLTITSIAVTGSNSGDFAETNNCPGSLLPSGSCTITVYFKPSTTGTRNAAVSFTDNAPNSPQKLPLTGVGVLPAVTFSPTSLTFPDQVVFTSSRARPITLTNNGLGTLLISKITANSPFSQTNNCPKSVAPGAKCTISVKFDPGNKGVFHGAVSVTDNAPGSPQGVALTGTGTYVQLAPAKLKFGTQPVGTRSGRRRITLTNKGDSAVNITGISITGADARDFFETNNCGNSVPSGASCLIKVTFTPLVKGKRTADVSVSDDGGGSPQKAELIGTGT
jgi:hypothetical protein